MAKVVKNEHDQWVLRSDWNNDDICNAMDNFSLKDTDCLSIMEMVAEQFDANDGIYWEVIQAVGDEFLAMREGDDD